jgi:hypothetical protein
MMLVTSILALALATSAPADTSVLVQGRSFLWFHRPEVRLIVTSPEDIRLTLTARNPEYFATIRLKLLAEGARDTAPVAELMTDSSSVDARWSTNRHTLWYRLTPQQLWAWAAGSTPTTNVGTITVVLDVAGRQKLRAMAQGTKPAIE